MDKTYNRRDFLRHSSTIGAGLALANIGNAVSARAQEKPAMKSSGVNEPGRTRSRRSG